MGRTKIDDSQLGLDIMAMFDQKANVSHVGSKGNSHSVVTTSEDGFMSSTDKSKLDNILNIILTGLSTASSVVVTATDSLLDAIGKLQAQISTIFAHKIAFTLCVVPNSSLCSLTFVAPHAMTIQKTNIVCRTIANATQAPTAATNIVLWKNGTAFLTFTNASGISDTEITASPLPASVAAGDKLDVRLSAANELNGLVSVTFSGVRA